MLFNVEKAWKKAQAEQAQLEAHLRRNGETLQSIQRHIPEAPEPIESSNQRIFDKTTRPVLPYGMRQLQIQIQEQER